MTRPHRPLLRIHATSFHIKEATLDMGHSLPILPTQGFESVFAQNSAMSLICIGDQEILRLRVPKTS